MEVIFTALHTDMQERFRKLATAKLAKFEKLDGRVTRIDVRLCAEHNPRQSGTRERVEITMLSRGPAIRAEASAEDRFTALDMALAKLESRVRRARERRKDRHGSHAAVRLSNVPEAVLASDAELPAIRLGEGGGLLANTDGASAMAAMAAAADRADEAPLPEDDPEDLVEIDTQGERPLVVREKFHPAVPMTIEQALFEMELVGHDFFLFTDEASGMPSVVYRRRGYQYGVIRLVEDHAARAGGTGRKEPATPEGSEHAANVAPAAAKAGGNGQLPANRGTGPDGLAARGPGSRRTAR